ncbi:MULTISPECIES: hypothetical protein [unclassified Nocardioides]|uniref:hypothetical protein n=1 Tax=unclassified Nocardioides TaxID=2615069 RepID=UPI0010554F3B|nr:MULTISPECIES: hypothetical protein [unclassified Nocardioides]
MRVHHRRPAFVEIYLRGRNNAAVHRFGREHSARVAQMLQEYAVEAGLATTELTPTMARLAVEKGRALVTAHLERHATPAGLTGIAR